jgi:putative redox protein
MEKNARCTWVEGLQFDVRSHSGKLVRMDSWSDREKEDSGPSPGEFLPMALGACTGMDVVFIAQKMRLELGGLDMEVQGVATDEHPKYYREFKVIFHFTGENLDEEKLLHAIALSRDKYCIVGNTFGESVRTGHFYTLNGGEMREVPESE